MKMTRLILLFMISNLIIAQPSKIRVACVGNSITYGFGQSNIDSYPQQLGLLLGSHYEVHNYGVGGLTMLKKGDFPYWKNVSFLDAKELIPQILILALGTNDSKPQNWQYKDEFYNDYKNMVEEFKKVNPNIHVFVCFPPPVFKDGWGITEEIIRNEISPLIDSVRKVLNTSAIDYYNPMLDKSNLFPDGIHPNKDGYKLMAQIARDALLASPSGIIRYFNADKPSFESGDILTLYWETTPESEVTINGQKVNSTDSMIVEPSPDSEYLLITNGVFQDSARIKLNYIKPGTIKSFNALPGFLDIGSGDTSIISWSTANGSSVMLDGEAVDLAGEKVVTPEVTTTYTLISNGETSDTAYQTVQVLESILINRALNKTVKASKTARDYFPESAVDGDSSTYWLSDIGKTQWFSVELGKYYDIRRVVIKWGNVFATTYSIEMLDKTNAVKKIYNSTIGDGDIDYITGLSGITKTVRLLCNNKNVTDSGYVIKEIEIYGIPEGAVAVQKRAKKNYPFQLNQNYPNPFNPNTNFEFQISDFGFVSLKVFDILGKEIVTLVEENKQPGEYKVKFDGSKLPSGFYFYRLQSGSLVAVKKMMLIK